MGLQERIQGSDSWRDDRSWRVVRWLHRRRPLLTAILVLIALGHTLITGVRPADLLDPSISWRFWLPWLLIAIGVGVRLWGAGNLRKNQEITDVGIYVLVRHPLYLGSLAFLLSYFITIGDPVLGLVLFGILVAGVYYPTMRSEEEELRQTFPNQYARYRPPPRLLPDLTRITEALSTDRFELKVAYGNLGLRSLWFIIALPLLLRLVSFAQTALAS